MEFKCSCGKEYVIKIEEVKVIKKELNRAKHVDETKTYKIANNPCKRCGELISWDGYDKETRPYPLHVDAEGHEIESCYEGDK